MAYQDAIIEFLTSPENFPLALKIGDYVNHIILRLHSDFWRLVNQQLASFLANSKYASSWIYVPIRTEDITKPYEQCWLAPVSSEDHSLYRFRFGLGQSRPNSEYQLYQGVAWIGAPHQDPNHPALLQLKQGLAHENLTKSDNEMLAWNWLNYWIVEGKTLIRLANEAERLAFVSEVAQITWAVFDRIVPLLEDTANQLNR
jgi:hypothetical protein